MGSIEKGLELGGDESRYMYRIQLLQPLPVDAMVYWLRSYDWVYLLGNYLRKRPSSVSR
ncbi:hypothetical protein BCR44DRAFT_1440948 [Catenaria anguillulae PL171]|uniref:Uncharacterized protein n=1 Tax=Catenaria anguillulae PL171 TaxID=765915 RepID=A0A1Y2HBU9_9FUNG|nr:hypothetical protein BCR44DRAFT_1440948 [Catenaria anguillulae PL171]